MTEDRDFLIEPLRELVRLFDELEIPNALMGGMAVAIHGIPRITRELNFVISLSSDRQHDFLTSFRKLGYKWPESTHAGLVDQYSAVAFSRDDGLVVVVDMLMAEPEYRQLLLRRHQRVVVDGIAAWVVSPEDLIILKLIAGRPRDIGDILDILMAQGQLDSEYLRHWSQHFGLTDRLNETLKLYGEMS